MASTLETVRKKQRLSFKINPNLNNSIIKIINYKEEIIMREVVIVSAVRTALVISWGL